MARLLGKLKADKHRNGFGESYPKISEGVFIEKKGKLFFVFDSNRSVPYETNQTGCLIARLCDGAHNTHEIILCISGEYKISPLTVESDVYSFLSSMRKRHLLEISYKRKGAKNAK